MKYNWEHPDWPNFTYKDSAIQPVLYQYALDAGRLSGGMAQLDDNLQYDAYIDLMVSEAIHTSQIEGELLDREDVRSSLMNYLGLSSPPMRVHDPRAEGVAALMIEVRKSASVKLTENKLLYWHKLVLPPQDDRIFKQAIQIGQWRDSNEPMQIVSGPIGYEKVHYEAPPSTRVPVEMDRFLNWYRETGPIEGTPEKRLPGPIRAALAHLWFESIHPFEDGNGRIGRAIAEHALSQDLARPVLLSLSTIIDQDRKQYYEKLHQASRPEMDVTPWVNWFCNAVLKAQNNAIQNIEFVLQKARFWDEHRHKLLNARQVKVINKMFAAGVEGFVHGMSAKKYMSIAGCSKATATRDLSDLVSKGCFVQLEGGGRNARYGFVKPPTSL